MDQYHSQDAFGIPPGKNHVPENFPTEHGFYPPHSLSVVAACHGCPPKGAVLKLSFPSILIIGEYHCTELYNLTFRTGQKGRNVNIYPKNTLPVHRDLEGI